MILPMFAAADSIRELQARIIRALRDGSVHFALSGSNATFAWIANVDESAARQYRNVEFIIDRADSENVTQTLSQLGLMADKLSDHICYRERITQHKRWVNRVLFAGEQFVDRNCFVPRLNQVVWLSGAPVVSLEQLITFQLSRWLLDDRVDLRDLIEVGLVDANWLTRLPAELGVRLKELFDSPQG